MMTPDWPYRREVLCVQTETRVRPSCGALGTTACGAAIYLGEVFACRASEECAVSVSEGDRGAAETVTRAVASPHSHTRHAAAQCVVVSRESSVPGQSELRVPVSRVSRVWSPEWRCIVCAVPGAHA